MRSSLLLLSLLLLCNLISEAQGIRLKKESAEAEHHKIHGGTLIRRSNGGVGEVTLCEDGHCSGKSRKLMANAGSSTTRSSSSSSPMTTSKNDKNGGSKADPSSTINDKPGGKQLLGGQEERFSVNTSPVSDHQEAAPRRHCYPDALDLAAMDYSPAKKKPPIHN